ncbi:hypothetical protein F5884DRAFT_506589 [Xylogone sp. PMI_703]|nr:hypothetical protein F5884DRAFT_506589 [Xylogone sp. PMI_703]
MSVIAAIIHAHFAENETEMLNAQLIYALKETIDVLKHDDHTNLPELFNYQAIEYGLCSYIETLYDYTINNHSVVCRDLSLILYALSPENWTSRCSINLQMLSTFLQRGLSPNMKDRGVSAWSFIFKNAWKLSRTSYKARERIALFQMYPDIMQLFLEHGADAKAVFKIDNKTRTARWLAITMFRDRFPEKARTLDCEFAERGARMKVSLLSKVVRLTKTTLARKH